MVPSPLASLQLLGSYIQGLLFLSLVMACTISHVSHSDGCPSAIPSRSTVVAAVELEIHGILNAVSWGIMFPVGIIMVRYLQTFLSAETTWFYLYAFCQVFAYAIGVDGWATRLNLGSESMCICGGESVVKELKKSKR
ncbi:hypothetical protein L2E82_01942 [Cichorium intybus]|uniref:Uncharacterized protein n=1 Tax=Cichorium intybus TaxID=13427 RepID=A0ACB9H1C6_CICIN|nr:hypothetical protein L2E82_01942 [Cichorium intybus]